MVKVTLTEAPIAAAPKAFDIRDTDGRTLTLKKPGVLAQFRLVEALGDSARNEVYIGMVMPLLFLDAIDGEKVPSPATKGEVEALIKRLDDAGITALMTEIPKLFGNAEHNEEAVKKFSE